MKESGDALAHAAEKLRGDHEVVLAAVKQSADVLEYAAEELRGDREVVLAAVKESGDALEHVAEELRGDREVVLVVVKETGNALAHAVEELRGDREFVLAAVQLEFARPSTTLGGGEVASTKVEGLNTCTRAARHFSLGWRSTSPSASPPERSWALGDVPRSGVRTCPPAGTHTLRTASVAHHPALAPPVQRRQTACHGGLPRILSTPWRDQRPEMEIVLEFCVFSEHCIF